MRRPSAILVLVALLLGAMSNIGLGLGITWGRPFVPSPRLPQSWYYIETSNGILLAFEERIWSHVWIKLEFVSGEELVSVMREAAQLDGAESRSIESLASWVNVPPAVYHPIDSRSHVSWACGWPMRSFNGTVIGRGPPVARVAQFIDFWQPRGQQTEFSPGLPVGVLWFGLLVNTVFFALAWVLLLFAALHATRVLRKSRSIRRGKCPVCGYDLLGDYSTGCPECGWKRSEPTRK